MNVRILPIFLPILAAWLGACDLGSGNPDPKPPDGGKKGVWRDTTFFPSGKVERISTKKDSLLDGISWVFFESGAVEGVGHYRNGRSYGWSLVFFESGAKQQEAFKSETAVLCLQTWDETGRLLYLEGTCLEEYYLDPTYSDWKLPSQAQQ